MLNRWVEVGNSGMFRPEMLEPMGFPKDVRVHGWGLSLERPTMIRWDFIPSCSYSCDTERCVLCSDMESTIFERWLATKYLSKRLKIPLL